MAKPLLLPRCVSELLASKSGCACTVTVIMLTGNPILSAAHPAAGQRLRRCCTPAVRRWLCWLIGPAVAVLSAATTVLILPSWRRSHCSPLPLHIDAAYEVLSFECHCISAPLVGLLSVKRRRRSCLTIDPFLLPAAGRRRRQHFLTLHTPVAMLGFRPVATTGAATMPPVSVSVAPLAVPVLLVAVSVVPRQAAGVGICVRRPTAVPVAVLGVPAGDDSIRNHGCALATVPSGASWVVSYQAITPAMLATVADAAPRRPPAVLLGSVAALVLPMLLLLAARAAAAAAASASAPVAAHACSHFLASPLQHAAAGSHDAHDAVA